MLIVMRSKQLQEGLESVKITRNFVTLLEIRDSFFWFAVF